MGEDLAASPPALDDDPAGGVVLSYRGRVQSVESFRLEVDQPVEGGLRVLWACDGSQSSSHPAEFLSRLTLPVESTGRVITVVNWFSEWPIWLFDEEHHPDAEEIVHTSRTQREAEQESTSTDMQRYCTELPEPFRSSEPIVAVGNPAEEILKAVETEDINIVILAPRGLGPAGRLLLGSTSENVLTHAHCSVLLVPQHERM